MPNNLGLDPFPDPVGHFGAPWRPFWISRPLIGRNPECSDQKTYLAKVDGSAQKPRSEHFPDPVGHFEAPWWPFWIFEVLIEGMIESKNLFSES